MLARLLLAHQGFRQVVGNGDHGVGILAGMRNHLQTGMIRIDRLNHVRQMPRVADILINRGERVAKVAGVLLRRLGLRLAGLQIQIDARITARRKIAGRHIVFLCHQPRPQKFIGRSQKSGVAFGVLFGNRPAWRCGGCRELLPRLGVLRFDIPRNHLPVIPIFGPKQGDDLAVFARRLEPEDGSIVSVRFLCFARVACRFVLLQGLLIVALELRRNAVGHAVDPEDVSILLLDQRQVASHQPARVSPRLAGSPACPPLDWWQPCPWRQHRERSAILISVPACGPYSSRQANDRGERYAADNSGFCSTSHEFRKS